MEISIMKISFLYSSKPSKVKASNNPTHYRGAKNIMSKEYTNVKTNKKLDINCALKEAIQQKT